MPMGKLSSQTGHAFANTLLFSEEHYPDNYKQYLTQKITGSKVALKAKNTNQLIKAYETCLDHNIPAILVVDENHVMPPHFNGEPIITALGIGPCKPEDVKFITKKFQCI